MSKVSLKTLPVLPLLVCIEEGRARLFDEGTDGEYRVSDQGSASGNRESYSFLSNSFVSMLINTSRGILRTLTLLSLFIFAPAAVAATYYVSTSGSHSNPGTISSPFATLQKAHDVAVAGDTIYMRGGTYNLNTMGQTSVTKSGTSGNPIKIFNYPGEAPILDGSSATYQWLTPINMDSASWWHIKGLEIKSSPYVGIALWGASNNNIIEQLEVHHSGRLATVGTGIWVLGSSANNLVLNNDVHHNREASNGNSDGLSVFSTGAGNVVRGNRAWRNSDDGIDMWNSRGVIVEGNWSWENGYDDNLQPLGDGNGFKLGGDGGGWGGHTVRNNISWRNKVRGFDDNTADIAITAYNNTGYENGWVNFAFANAGVASVLKNNLSFGSPDGVYLDASVQQSFNSWNLPSVTVGSADFASLNFSALATTLRNADGSLPTTNFLHLVAGSNLINKGIPVGFPYNGSAPDLGACEYGGSVTTPPPSSLPDVIITSLSYANGVFTSTVKNQGTVATPSGIFIGVGYSADGVFRTWGGSSTPLAAGASVTIGTDSEPYTIPTGTHTIVAHVDDVNRFAESNETNNQRSQSITVGGAPDTTPPTVPTGFTAVASASQVSLSWNASSDNVGVTGYRVYRNGTQIAAPASNSYIDGNLVPGTYSYTVAAVDAAGNVSAQSGSVSATELLPPSRLRLSLASPVSFNAAAEGKT